MARVPGAEAVYAAADLFRQRCLIEHKSLLWPNHDAWTVENIDGLLDAFTGEQANDSDQDFLEKWKDQLANQPDDVIRIAADVVTLYCLFPSDMNKSTKLKLVEAVISWRPGVLGLPTESREFLNTVFESGVGKCGPGYQTHRPWEVAFQLMFAQSIISGQVQLNNAAQCQQRADLIRKELGVQVQSKHVLLHLFFPENFERISSEAVKAKIAKSFAHYARGETDLDAALSNIRRALETENGTPDFDFYGDGIRELWDVTSDGSADRLDVGRVRKTVERNFPDPSDRLACLRVLAEAIKLAHSISPGSWSTAHKAAHVYMNVSRPYVISSRDGLIGVMVDRDDFDHEQWQQLLEEHGVSQRFENPFKSVPNSPNAHIINIPTNSLKEVLPLILPSHQGCIERLAKSVGQRLSPYKGHFPSVVEYLRQELGEDLPDPDYQLTPPPSTQHTWLVQANPEIWNVTEDLRRRTAGSEDTWTVNRYVNEIKPGDRLLIWQSGPNAGLLALGELTSKPFERPTSEFWPDKDARPDTEHAVNFRYTQILPKPLLRSELLAHPVLKDLQVIRAAQGTNFKVTDEQWDGIAKLLAEVVPPTADDVARTAFMDVAEIRELEELLVEKRQIVLEGPPGSGKTFIADLLARYVTGNPLSGSHNEQVQIVQFHQSYGYEDFIQGIRPRTDEHGQLRYEVVPGIFVQFCETARKNPDQRFVLVIDEINRGNISRIFGELMLLLEYRNKSVRLPYGDAASGTSEFSIPENLYLIGTMNSTDRSLALIDYALRRRFYFYQLLPVRDGAAPVLDGWLDMQELEQPVRQQRLALFIALNTRIAENLSTDFQIGHSYFMTADIGTAAGLDRVWRRAIMPLLTEYFHNTRDQQHVLESYQPERLVPSASTPGTDVPLE